MNACAASACAVYWQEPGPPDQGRLGVLELRWRTFWKGKQQEVAEQRGDQPGEQKDQPVSGRRIPETRVPEHLQQRVIAVHRRLVGEPNNSSGQRSQRETV